ncbi:MAG: hypothetical protein Fur0032_10190 [Terrimicrobiaceae bacterium]
MKSRALVDTFRRLRPPAKAVLVLFAAGLLTSCAAVQVRVRPDSPVERKQIALAASARDPETSALVLKSAFDRGVSDQARVEALVEAARLAWPGVMRGEAGSQFIYRAAIRALTDEVLRRDGVTSLPLSGATRRLVVDRAGKATIDPFAADLLIPADQIDFAGMSPRVTEPGVGLPFVAWYRDDSPVLRLEPGVSKNGLTVPVTALLTFEDSSGEKIARLSWVNSLLQERVTVGGRTMHLAADYSAPIALLSSKGKNRAIDLRSMIRSDAYLSEAGLFQYQPYEAGKIPVVFVHGLMSRPEVWINALNLLMADENIRDRYQFWFFRYPSGLPVWSSAALLRRELNRFNKALLARTPDGRDRRVLDSKVLIGHSMGGIVSNLLIRDGGDFLWNQFSDVPLDEVRLQPEAMRLMNEFIRFESRDDISRVIFVATPHRGSLLASRPISRVGAALIRLPFPELDRNRARLLDFLREDARILFRAPANSIRFLRPHSPLLLSILNLPRDESIPLHSIIGDRGRGDTPESSDGVVHYWSSHLDFAVSEKIVPSGHGANEHPDGIAEMRRILLENLRSTGRAGR